MVRYIYALLNALKRFINKVFWKNKRILKIFKKNEKKYLILNFFYFRIKDVQRAQLNFENINSIFKIYLKNYLTIKIEVVR